MIVSVPLEGAVTVTWQLDWFGFPVGASWQLPPVAPPVPVTLTAPEGADAVPPACASVTVSVAWVVPVAGTEDGESERLAVVWRPLTFKVTTCVATCGVGEDESAAWSVKTKLPAAEGVPEIVLPERANPPGRAPEEIVQVIGAVPPVDWSVAV